ncbi:bifunctional aminoglycoside phosphotransferase/ATP-binding protein [Methyloglobulus morosus]|nr:bifunctional aminoglycoside phosphotransferase/ATP-binding protein [Methyloglobulus morosus]
MKKMQQMGGNKIESDSSPSLIKGLFEADAYPHETDAIRLIETHISWVLLTGQYAYKIKKPVNFGFLDFSTLDKRRHYCHEEIRLNRRLAKDWYLDVVPITGQHEHPKMDGTGIAIDYAIKMRQFPSPQTLRESAESGELKPDEIDQITRIIADFHNAIEKAEEQSPYGDSQDIKHWFDENFHHIQPLLDDKQQLSQLEGIAFWGNNEWLRKSALMQQRKQQGFIRECHGDLHLGNMALIGAKVVIFDCIEFNPSLRWIDVISEAAFLVMDLLHLGYDGYAYRFLNRYLQHTGDYQGLALLRYYLTYRALVRAKVTLLRKAQNSETSACEQILSDYTDFADLAERFTKTSPVMLIITHGFSGSGKSTYASQLAEKIGAIQIRSDIERKRLFGYSAHEATHSDIESGVYTQEAGQRTYRHLVGLAKTVVDAGFSVIIDAAFLKVEQRELFRKLADECRIKFSIIDFQASEETLCNRIKQRQLNPSEATIAVLHQQQQAAQPLSDEEKNHVVTINTERNGHALEQLLTALSLLN